MDSKTMLSTFVFVFLSMPSLLLSYKLEKLPLPSNKTGPEALAFDYHGVGPYTGVSNGRILKYVNATVGFVDFAVTSPNRSQQVCDGLSHPAPNCGRPSGLGFNKQTGNLFIADAFVGLVEVGHNGGIATQLATSAEGVRFRSLNGLDIDQRTGIVYFTDASAKYELTQFDEAFRTGDRTGRLMKYDFRSKKLTVLKRDIGIPVGLAVSKNGRFVLYSEALDNRVVRFWLKGSKANTYETFATFNERPDNIKRNANGEFWVAFSSSGVRVDEDGKILQALALGVDAKLFYSEVHEYKGRIYVGSGVQDYVGIINSLS